MKLGITILFLFFSTELLFSQIIDIPDPIFKNRLIEEGIDTNNDGEIQESEALVVTDLDVNGALSSTKIESLIGIEYFTNLISLNCFSNIITTLDVSTLTELEYLKGYDNELTSINLSGLNNLNYLNIRHNSLINLDLSSLINLELLFLGGNESINLDLSDLINLTVFECGSCGLSNIDFQNNNNLDEIAINNNSLTTINFSELSQLRILFMDNNLFTELDLTEALSLEWIECRGNVIEILNIDGLLNLNEVYINDNLLTEIDASNSSLVLLHCDNNPNLNSINIQNNYSSFPDPDLLFFPLQLNNLPNLQSICMDFEDWEALNFSNYNPENVTVFTGPNCTLGLNEFSINETYIYPNPIKDNFTINTNVEIINYTLIDITGKVINQSNYINKIKQSVLSLNKGLYFLILKSSNGNNAILKFIKE